MRAPVLLRWNLIFGVLWTLGASATAAAADAQPLILEHLTTADGLPQATVMSTLQDSQGFVWLGTEDGLVRFDSHALVRYAYSRNTRGTLPGSFIWQVIEDAHHDLWLALKDAGLARWNRATDTFTVYRHDPNSPASLASDSVRAVLVDADGRVWVGTSDSGVDVLDPASGRFEHLRHDPRDAASLINDRIFTLARDRSGNVWVGTETGLERWQPEHRAFVHSLGDKQISQVMEDQSGALWVGTFDAGLTRMDHEGRIVESFRHDPKRPTSLSHDDVRAILEDQAGNLWIGTADGLDLLDRQSGQFSRYGHDAGDAESLRDSFVMSLYEDQAGLVWIGTRAGGVSRWNPHSWELGGRRPAWLGSKAVSAFADAPDNRVWIAGLGGGLFQFDGDTGKAIDVDDVTGRRNTLGDASVMSLRQDHLGTLWIGTMANGLQKLTPDGHLDSIPVKPGDPRSLSAAGIMTIVESRNGRIWLGTFGGGANVLDPVTGLIRQLPYDPAVPGATSSANVTAIAEDARGNLWIGTDGGGLDLAQADGTVLKAFRHDASDANSLPANTVYALALDAQGRLWVATDGGGLALVVGSPTVPESIRFHVVSRNEGLSSDTIYGVVPDARGHLWLSGNAGLMRFEPDTGVVKTYHREHGLQGEEFQFNAYHRLRDGRLCFGGPGGFNIFDPARLTESRQPPRLALTGIEVLGVPAPGKTPYWLRDQVTLDHRASVVSLDFGVLDFTSPQHNRLAYRMAGLTDRWLDLGTQRRITLTNLDSGDHVLEVRAANSDSQWSKTPLQIRIHRDPAPWRSPWAYTFYALAALGLIAYRLHRHRIKFQEVVRARARLEAEVKLRTRELVESNRQLAEAAQAKSNFLDRMSHELRTPMNGVVGMTELLTRTQLSSAQSRLTQTIRSSAQVLLQIVNDLLDLSKIQAGKVQLEALPVDLVQILEECTSLFTGAAETKGIELIVCPPPRDSHGLLGDPLRVRQILMNLVGNAVKFTTQGEVVVKADIDSATPDRPVLQLSVADTGIGMDAKAIGKIFEPFTQADESTTRRFGGSGLGLAICRELAELMGGSIAVESQPQVGSTFTLSLPMKVGAEQPSEPASLPAARVRILTRRPALAESLKRHVLALGLSVLPDERGGSLAAAGDVIILDAGSHQDYRKMYPGTAGGPGAPVSPRPALVVVATTAEVQTAGLASLTSAETTVPKPVHRAVLREALASAMGVRTANVGATSAAIPNMPTLSAHVLLVEDEPVNAAVAEGYLAELGCTAVWVKDGAEAVARNGAERFDLILMDLSMPGMDGFATTALIRQRGGAGGRVPIVALSAHDAANYRESCLKAGMDDMLSKPYTLEQCAQLLRRWIARAPEQPKQEVPPLSVRGTSELSSVDAKAVAGLRKLRAGSQADLYAKLVDLFRTGSAESLAQMGAALEAGDLKTAGAVCHKLTSSAANVGALIFAKQVRELGQLCNAGDKACGWTLYQSLQAAHPALIEELMDLRLRETA